MAVAAALGEIERAAARDGRIGARRGTRGRRRVEVEGRAQRDQERQSAEHRGTDDDDGRGAAVEQRVEIDHRAASSADEAQDSAVRGCGRISQRFHANATWPSVMSAPPTARTAYQGLMATTDSMNGLPSAQLIPCSTPA